MYSKFVFLVVNIMCTVLFISCTASIQENTRPNILIVMVDDLGFSDISCYGGEIPTPNIDSLAANGIKYTQFYNAARCCPSRASLMTGLYPHQTGIGHMMNDLGYDSYRGDLSSNTVTVAEVLKEGGYSTYMAGKWHLTRFSETTDTIHNWPLQRGFDKFYGTLPGYGSQYNPSGLAEGNQFIEPSGNFYYTEALSRKAMDYLKETRDSQSPFFMYLAYAAPHYPLHAKKEAIEKHKGRFSNGWDSLRSGRLERLKHFGILDSETRLPDRDDMAIPWIDEHNKSWQETRMEAYAGMIEHLDQGIGDIVRTLKELNQLDNTLIFFLSDNGGSAEGHLNNTVERWGIRWKSKRIPGKTRDGKLVTAGDFPGLELGAENTFGSYGPKWSSVSNAPFRMHKNWVHEGGISTPLIVHWPTGIDAKGELRRQRGHIMDIMPTCIDASEAKYPVTFNGHKIKPLSGTSLVPSFNNGSLRRNEPLYWEHEGNRAIIKGNWKLVSAYPGSWSSMIDFRYKGNWELYNLQTDRTETNNLSNQYPKIVQDLSEDWEKWAKKIGVKNYSDFGLTIY